MASQLLLCSSSTQVARIECYWQRDRVWASQSTIWVCLHSHIVENGHFPFHGHTPVDPVVLSLPSLGLWPLYEYKWVMTAADSQCSLYSGRAVLVICWNIASLWWLSIVDDLWAPFNFLWSSEINLCFIHIFVKHKTEQRLHCATFLKVPALEGQSDELFLLSHRDVRHL